MRVGEVVSFENRESAFTVVEVMEDLAQRLRRLTPEAIEEIQAIELALTRYDEEIRSWGLWSAL